MRAKIHYLCFEAAVETDDERVICERQDIPLGKHLFHLVSQNQVALQQPLHRKDLPRLSMPHQIYGTETKRRRSNINNIILCLYVRISLVHYQVIASIKPVDEEMIY